MEKVDLQEIPYKRVTTIVVMTLIVIFDSIGQSEWFPSWCFYTIIAIFIALPIFWIVHALMHNRKKAALIYLMIDVFVIILLAIKFYLIH